MTTEGKVSPLPWKVDTRYLSGAVSLDDKDGCGVLFHQAAWKPTKGDLAFIVRAVNAHDRLVAALEGLLANPNPACADLDCCAASRAYSAATNEAKDVLAALAAAKEGK